MSSDEQPPVDSPADAGGDPTQVMPPVQPSPKSMPDAVAPAGGEPPVPPPPTGRSGAGRFALWLAIILMLLLLISVIAALLTRSNGETPEVSASASESPSVTPSPTPSPSVTPSPSPTPTETTEAPSGPQFVLYSVPQEALCPDESTTLDITVTWESTGADRAWVGIATTNAKDEPFSEVPTSGSVALPFPCSNESQVYTVTLEGDDGALVSESETVTRNLS